LAEVRRLTLTRDVFSLSIFSITRGAVDAQVFECGELERMDGE
jgi:hypothetical protein